MHGMFSTHMEALKSMKEYIGELKEDYIVLMDSDTVLNIDLANVIKTHEQTGAEITFVTANAAQDFTSKNPRVHILKEIW